MYTADWNSIKLSAAYTYTWMESAAAVGLASCLGSAISTPAVYSSDLLQ